MRSDFPNSIVVWREGEPGRLCVSTGPMLLDAPQTAAIYVRQECKPTNRPQPMPPLHAAAIAYAEALANSRAVDRIHSAISAKSTRLTQAKQDAYRALDAAVDAELTENKNKEVCDAITPPSR